MLQEVATGSNTVSTTEALAARVKLYEAQLHSSNYKPVLAHVLLLSLQATHYVSRKTKVYL